MTRITLTLALVLSLGCDAPVTTSDASVDDAAAPAERPAYRQWLKIEPPGAVCGNGSQYKFFVSYTRSEDVLVVFEAGGACWDYASCSGAAGVRGAAHPDGIPDDLMSDWELGSPLLRRDRINNPLATWNIVFIPYCTGDVHIGDREVVYEDPEGVGPPLTWRHVGYRNTQAVIGWMREQFPSVDRMFVSGCSAGGTGAINNYYFLRTALAPARGYLVDDSGPIFSSMGNSGPLHEHIRTVWGLDDVIAEHFSDFAPALGEDLGAINTLLADEFPEDRLVTAFYRLDYNYSLYSYERFYDSPPREEIYRLWWEDTQDLVATYDTRDNLAYYIPFWRELNDSHCLTLLEWAGTEIEEDGVDFHGYLEEVLDDSVPLTSHLEEAREGPYADIAP